MENWYFRLYLCISTLFNFKKYSNYYLSNNATSPIREILSKIWFLEWLLQKYQNSVRKVMHQSQFSQYLAKTINLEPKCSRSFSMADWRDSSSSKLAIASPEGLPSRFKMTLMDLHLALGKKKSFISCSVARNGNPDIFRQNLDPLSSRESKKVCNSHGWNNF